MFRWVLLVTAVSFCAISCDEGYDVRSEAVYYKDWNEARGTKEYLIEEADPTTFEIIENPDYGKDAHHVFYQTSIIEGADPATFRIHEYGYATDKRGIYQNGIYLKGSTDEDFEALDYQYCKCKSGVFYDTTELNVCSVDNFKLLSEINYTQWSTDGCHYFCEESVVPSEEYDNIFIYENGRGLCRDSKHIYYFGYRLEYDRNDVRVLDTLDVESFEVVDQFTLKDKFGCIQPERGREECE